MINLQQKRRRMFINVIERIKQSRRYSKAKYRVVLNNCNSNSDIINYRIWGNSEHNITDGVNLFDPNQLKLNSYVDLKIHSNDCVTLTAKASSEVNCWWSASYSIDYESMLGKTYEFYAEYSKTGSDTNLPYIIIQWYDADNKGITPQLLNYYNTFNTTKTFTVPETPPEGAVKLLIAFYVAAGSTVTEGDTVTYKNIKFYEKISPTNPIEIKKVGDLITTDDSFINYRDLTPIVNADKVTFIDNGIRITNILGNSPEISYFQMDYQNMLGKTFFVNIDINPSTDAHIGCAVCYWLGEGNTIVGNPVFRINDYYTTFYKNFTMPDTVPEGAIKLALFLYAGVSSSVSPTLGDYVDYTNIIFMERENILDINHLSNFNNWEKVEGSVYSRYNLNLEAGKTYTISLDNILIDDSKMQLRLSGKDSNGSLISTFTLFNKSVTTSTGIRAYSFTSEGNEYLEYYEESDENQETLSNVLTNYISSLMIVEGMEKFPQFKVPIIINKNNNIFSWKNLIDNGYVSKVSDGVYQFNNVTDIPETIVNSKHKCAYDIYGNVEGISSGQIVYVIINYMDGTSSTISSIADSEDDTKCIISGTSEEGKTIKSIDFGATSGGLQQLTKFSQFMICEKRNLFDVNKYFSNYINDENGISYNNTVFSEIYHTHILEGEFKPNTCYTLSVDYEITNSDNNGITFQIAYADGGSESIGSGWVTGSKKESIKLTNPIHRTISYICFPYYTGLRTCEVKLTNIQIEEGKENTFYKPFYEEYNENEEKVNLFLDRPLLKLNEYADYIDFSSQKRVSKFNYEKWTLKELMNLTTVYRQSIFRTFPVSTNLRYKPMTGNKAMSGYSYETHSLSTVNSYVNAYSHNGSFHWIVASNYSQIISPDDSTTLADYFDSIGLDKDLEFAYVLDDGCEIIESIIIPKLSINTDFSTNFYTVDTDKLKPYKIDILYV